MSESSTDFASMAVAMAAARQGVRALLSLSADCTISVILDRFLRSMAVLSPGVPVKVVFIMHLPCSSFFSFLSRPKMLQKFLSYTMMNLL